MKIKRPKSHIPKVHDNTEGDLILVPPCVLENKLALFEEYTKIKATLGANVGLWLTLAIAIVTPDFKDFLGFSGARIRGAFVTAFIIMTFVIIIDIFKLYRAPVK